MKTKLILTLILLLTISIAHAQLTEGEKASISSVKEGQIKTFEYSTNDIIQKITSNFTHSGGFASITVTDLGKKPAITLTRERTYTYVQIEPAPNDLPMEKIFVRFKVNRDWIWDSNLLENEVTLKKLVNNKWENIRTKHLSSGENFYYFEASMMYFEEEYYSIGKAEKEIEESVEEPKPIPKPEPIVENVTEEANQTAEIEEPIQEELIEDKPQIAKELFLWGGSILTISILLIVLAHQKKRIKRMMMQKTKNQQKDKLEILRIVDYIQNAETKGKTRSDIMKDLKKVGWEKKKIKKAFNELKY